MATGRYRTEGYVALFDVLGFSNRVERHGLEELDRYVETVVEAARLYEGLGTILFSDSVVAYTMDAAPASFAAISTYASGLLHALIEAAVPVRGAISYGTFLRSESADHGTFIAGRPILEAHHFERQMQCVGVMIAPSVLEHDESLPGRCGVRGLKALPPVERASHLLQAITIQRWKDIPLEPTPGHLTAYDGFSIVPIPTSITSDRDVRRAVRSTSKRLQRLKQLAPDARSQGKYSRTLEWLRSVDEALNQSGV